MTDILDMLWRITLGAWITAGAILLVRLLFGRWLSARSKYMLWLLLLLRLMLPVLPESPTSVMNVQSIARLSTMEAERSIQAEAAAGSDPDYFGNHFANAQQMAQGGVSATADAAQTVGMQRTKKLLIFWLTGAGICGICYGGMVLRTFLHLRKMERVMASAIVGRCREMCRQMGIRRTITLRYGDRAMIGGLLIPTLILPRELMGQRLKAAMIHELMHYKSGDLLIMALWRVLCCVYWFNPVVWLCLLWARRDCESACDQRVLDSKKVPPAAYAALLYEEGTMKRFPRVGTTAFGGGGLKSRIQKIAKYQKPKVGMTVLAAAICLLITACTMTEGITGGKVDTGKQTVTETAAASAEDPKDENASEQAMMAHVMCQWMNGMKFDLEDHDYFWRVMSYYAANVFMDYDALDEDTAHATFTADQVVEIAGEVFPTLYIHDVSELPGIPGYVLEEGVEALVTLLDNSAYRFTLGNYGDVTLNLAPISDQGAIRQMQGTLVDGEGGELGTWIITMAADGSITDVEPQ